MTSDVHPADDQGAAIGLGDEAGRNRQPRVDVVRDIAFGAHGLLLDLYRPSGAGPVPVVLWLHGGGWFTGDRTLAPDLAERAGATGLAYASIEYRLSGTALFPAQLHDVREAIRHLREHAADLGLDPDAVAVWGASAGGHLAALAGLTGEIEALPGEAASGPVPVRAVAASYPPVDLTEVVEQAQARLPDSDGSGTPEARLLGGHPADRPELAAAASPMTWLAELDAAGGAAPPFQISHGTADVLVSHRQGERLHDALVAGGHDSELYLLDGYRHGFLNPPGRLDVALARVMDDGRLVTQGPATATRRTTAEPEPADATFGFEDVDAFLVRHLAPARRVDPTQAVPAAAPAPSSPDDPATPTTGAPS